MIVTAKSALALALAVSATATATAASAQEMTHDQAETRARACLSAGAGGAPQTSLLAAVRALSALCSPQITRLRDIRVREATVGLDRQDTETETRRVNRALNDEIVQAVANFTGLHN